MAYEVERQQLPLFDEDGRSGATDAEIAGLWCRAVASKLPGHGINDPGFLQPARPMSAIGG